MLKPVDFLKKCFFLISQSPFIDQLSGGNDQNS